MILSHYQAATLLAAHQQNQTQVMTSLDLNRSTQPVTLDEQGVQLSSDVHLSRDVLNEIASDENGCFVVDEGDAVRIQAFSEVTGRYVSLMPTPGPPTLLIAGFPMHRIKHTDPAKDTRSKIKALGRIRGHVLDTSTGAGYTAIELSRQAEQVTTIELDPAVITVIRQNPWSQALFRADNIRQLIGDSYDYVEEFDDASFDCILHDPPTFQLAGDLYSGDYYRHLYRILVARGRLFHYIGDPDSQHGSRVTRGVVRRLQDAGFTVKPRPQAYGVLALKK